MKTVGILGGMGPAATVELMRRVIDLTPASDDAGHIRMLVDNNPAVPSRIGAILQNSGQDPGPILAEMAHSLELLGADFLAMPCNTAHYYLPVIREAVTVPILNMVELATLHILERHTDVKQVGLLASSSLRNIRLYEPYFDGNGVRRSYPRPGCQRNLMNLILQIKAGSRPFSHAQELVAAAANLASQDTNCLLVSCTELSSVTHLLKTNLPVYDSLDVLAGTILREAMS